MFLKTKSGTKISYPTQTQLETAVLFFIKKGLTTQASNRLIPKPILF